MCIYTQNCSLCHGTIIHSARVHHNKRKLTFVHYRLSMVFF